MDASREKGAVWDVFEAFVCAWLAKVLKLWGLYPAAAFERAVFCGTQCYTPRHSGLREYLRSHAASVCALAKGGRLAAVRIVAREHCVSLNVAGPTACEPVSAGPAPSHNDARAASLCLASFLAFDEAATTALGALRTGWAPCGWQLEVEGAAGHAVDDALWSAAAALPTGVAGAAAAPPPQAHAAGTCVRSASALDSHEHLPVLLEMAVA